MIELSAIIDQKELRALRAERVMPAVVRAMRKAGSKALRDMRAEASKRVRQRKRLKAKAVRQALRQRHAKGNKVEGLTWSLDVADTPARAADYPHRQTKQGVSVAINRGQRSLIKHAFLATMKSGHKGVFVRRGLKRLPIDERMASRVIDAIRHEGEIPGVLSRGQETFSRTFRALLPAELEKVKSG